MSVIAENRTGSLQHTGWLHPMKSMQSETLGLVRDPHLTVVLMFATVGLLLSILY
jgi:hypothetical protein